MPSNSEPTWCSPGATPATLEAGTQGLVSLPPATPLAMSQVVADFGRGELAQSAVRFEAVDYSLEAPGVRGSPLGAEGFFSTRWEGPTKALPVEQSKDS